MAEQDDSERSEEATQQRREDFRRRGQVAQSREIASVVLVLTSLLALFLLGRFFLEQMHQIFTKSFTDYVVTAARDEDWFPAVKFATIKTMLVIGPLSGILWIMGALSTVLQVGFLTNEEALKLDFERINPISGFKKVFALRSVVEGIKAILKVTLITSVVYFIVKDEVLSIPKLSTYDIQPLMHYIAMLMARLFGWVIVFMLGLAILDFMFQRWELEKQMRMTKQEIKEEIKSREGDPLIRARVRRLQREMANRRMMESVKKADVIITNPTHIAVALQYSNKMVAPQLVAKGADEVAERIKKVAKEFKVPIVENKPLARTIFKTLKIGQVIPRELYTAVAEVLSYIFRLKKKRFA